MSGPIKLLLLAAFLVVGGLLFGVGMDMAFNHQVYYLNTTLCKVLGWLLMIVAPVPFLGMLGFTLGFFGGELAEEPPAPPEDVFQGKPVVEKPITPSKIKVENTNPEDQPIVAPLREHPHLIGLSGDVPNRIEIPTGVFTIGRGPDCDLILSSQLVSRRHAEVKWDGENLFLIDLGSSNSTRVNDVKVQKETLLNDGDVIQIVEYSLEVELPSYMAKTIIRAKKDHTSEPPVETLRVKPESS